MRIALDTNVTIAGDKDLLILINHGQVKLGLRRLFYAHRDTGTVSLLWNSYTFIHFSQCRLLLCYLKIWEQNCFYG